MIGLCRVFAWFLWLTCSTRRSFHSSHWCDICSNWAGSTSSIAIETCSTRSTRHICRFLAVTMGFDTCSWIQEELCQCCARQTKLGTSRPQPRLSHSFLSISLAICWTHFPKCSNQAEWARQSDMWCSNWTIFLCWTSRQATDHCCKQRTTRIEPVVLYH